jgi:hypothetical protein
MNTIIACSSGNQLEDLVEVAVLPYVKVYPGHWNVPGAVVGEVIEDGWSRYYEFILPAW